MSIYLDNNRLTSLDGLESLDDLERLSLHENDFGDETDLSKLSSMTSLVYLGLNDSDVESLVGLEPLTDLDHLAINQANLRGTLEPLRDMTRQGPAWNARIQTTGLEGCTDLEYVYLGENDIDTLAPWW